jgi:phage terminase large subunit-like protein
LVFGPQGGECYSVAKDREQAGIIFEVAKYMVQSDPELSQLIKVYKSALVVEATGSSYKVRSADSGGALGLSPTWVCFDELEAQPNRDLWDAMDLGRGARPESMLLGIGTAGSKSDSHGNDTIAYELAQYSTRVSSGEVVDPSWFTAWWEPKDPAADWTNPKVWESCNPGYGDIVGAQSFADDIKKVPEAVFRTYRLCQFVNSRTAWLPSGAWEACQSDREIKPGVPCVLGFDGSRTNDSTALVLVTIEAVPHVKLLALWERPLDADPHWRIHDSDVLPILKELCEKWHPREIAADVNFWHSQLEDFAEETGVTVTEIVQSGRDMEAGTEGLFQAITQGRITHDPSPSMDRHLANTTVKHSPTGDRVSKEGRSSGRKIDITVAIIEGLIRSRALWTEDDGVGEGFISLTQRAAELGPERVAQMAGEQQDRVDAIIKEELARRRQVQEPGRNWTSGVPK